jgi:hypothetical protein
MSFLRRLCSGLLRSDGALISALAGALPGLWFSQVVWGGLAWLDGSYWSGTGFPDSGDVHAGLGAEQHFIRAPWGLPLFSLQTIAPEGVPLSLLATDAIALTALIGKLLATLGLFVNVYAAWFIVVPVLQGAAAGLLAWALGGGGRLRPFAAALLALSYGHWLQKSAIHPINAGHFTILIALAAGAAIATGRITPRRGLLVTALLVPLALLETPYMAAMTIMIGAGSLLIALRAGLSRRTAAIALGALLAFLAIALPLGGWTSFAADWRGGSDDYGNLGANALSLLWPTRFPLVPGFGLDPFRLPVPPGQDIDSEVFIGAAALLLIAIGLLRARLAGIRRGLVRFWPLIAGAALSWAFALTNNLGIGPFQIRLFELPEPLAPLFHAFRWSSRFTWPAAYLLMIGGLVAASSSISWAPLARLRPLRVVPALLALVIAGGGFVQALNHGDINAVRAITTLYPTTYGERGFADRSLEGADALVLYPAHTCFSDIGLSGMDYDADRLMRDQHTYWMTASGKRGISTTAAKLNRGNDALCYGADGYGELIAKALRSSGTTLALQGRLGRSLEGRILGIEERCAAVPGMTVCTTTSMTEDPWVRAAGLRLAPSGLPLVDGPIEASELQMGALLAWADGFSRRANDPAIWEVWRPNEDPRVSEARLPVLAGPGSASLRAAARLGTGTTLVLELRARGATRVIVDGTERLFADGESISASGSLTTCDARACGGSVAFEIVTGELELLEVSIR